MTDNRIVLINREGKKLTYEYGADVIYLDMQRVTLRHASQKQAIWLLLQSLGRVVTHAEIVAILDKSGQGNKNDAPNSRSGKFIAQLRAELKHSHDLHGLIKNVRSAGYIVGEGWTRPPSEIRIQKSHEFLDMLDNVVSDCIRHANDMPLITCQNGLQYIAFKIDFSLQKFKILNSMLWDIIRILSSTTAKPSDLIEIKASFHDLSSYVLYWRIGDGLSEEKWKADYRDEIRTQARKIHQQVEAIMKDIERSSDALL
ncbi:response regulator transcription factor [Pseudolabrys taiwanensis]|nr:response regulator transcription factor [Pseudolabrys taiwanensis]